MLPVSKICSPWDSALHRVFLSRASPRCTVPRLWILFRERLKNSIGAFQLKLMPKRQFHAEKFLHRNHRNAPWVRAKCFVERKPSTGELRALIDERAGFRVGAPAYTARVSFQDQRFGHFLFRFAAQSAHGQDGWWSRTAGS